MLKIATWNVNSLKVRLEQVLEWLEANPTDILALQETKLTDDQFPLDAFKDKGYFVEFSGQKTYNGVAIISKNPLADVHKDIIGLDDPQRRILAATVGDIRVIDLYVPNGSEVASDKYHYKLDWLTKVNQYLKGELQKYPKLVVLGDFNIAPEDRDVHDPKEWEGNILVSPPERDAFFSLLDLGLIDSFRLFEQPEKSYSWWDYRMLGFRRNRGLRIDHVLLSKALAGSCRQAVIDREPRKAERPSDHAPVWVLLE